MSGGHGPSALTDADVPAWWQRLGLPGLIDIHTHFLPERMLRRVWAHFDEAGPWSAGPGRSPTAPRRTSGSPPSAPSASGASPP